MTNFIIQNWQFAVAGVVAAASFLAGTALMGIACVNRCEDCISAKRAREISGREQARVEALGK